MASVSRLFSYLVPDPSRFVRELCLAISTEFAALPPGTVPSQLQCSLGEPGLDTEIAIPYSCRRDNGF